MARVCPPHGDAGADVPQEYQIPAVPARIAPPLDALPGSRDHLSVPSEVDLVTRACSGDPAAVDELLAAHLPALRAYLRIHLPAELRQRESCSDLVNSVAREVLQAQDGFDYRGPEAFRGWLYSWARHKIQDRLRYWHADKRAIGRERQIGEDESLGQLAAGRSGSRRQAPL